MKKEIKYMFHFRKYKKAFTLAEVLITLTIVGVIAAIVIPSLINYTQEKALHTALKEAFSIFSQATKMVMLENGGTMAQVSNSGSWSNDSDTVRAIYEKYLKIEQKCGADYSDSCKFLPPDYKSYCYSNPAYNNGCTFNIGRTGWHDGSSIELSNGMIAVISYTSPDCTGESDSIYPNSCGYVMVDVNGHKEPNRWGYDVYKFYILKEALVPVGIKNPDGTNDPTGKCDPNTTSGYYQYGMGCAAVMLQNN